MRLLIAFLPCILFAGPAAEDGIPVTDPLVIAKCGSCHSSDAQGNMQRISWARTTPEVWQDVLKDMIVMNGLSITPEEARPVVKYLSDHHGLTAAESKPVLYEPERRVVEETNVPTETLRGACAKCHDFARPLSWRRSPAEWKQFDDSHAKRYKYKPNAEAVAFLSEAAPLHTLASDTVGSVDPSGRWLVTATLAGYGKYFGEMQVDRAGAGEYSTRLTLTSIKTGLKMERTGRSAVYANTAWRGRSAVSAQTPATPDDPSSDLREVMWIAPDGRSGEGRWFWGQYQEFGFNVELRRPSADPALLFVDAHSLKPGSRANRVRLIGENFPARVATVDLSLGAGVTVRRIASSNPHEIVAIADVAASAPAGKRNVAFRRSVVPGALAVYDRIDYITVTPESAMAAFGDSKHPRGYRQFEAIGYQRGPDGKVHTADDVELGPVEVSWSLQVFHAPDGSNPDFVGKMSPSGLLTPSVEHPDNNFDTWVIATAKDEKNADGEPMSGRAYVVITVPTYAFNGRQYVRDLARWVDDGPAIRPADRERRQQ